MTRLSPATVATMILTSPDWARLGLTGRDHRLRQRAADEVAGRIVAGLDEPEPASEDPPQMALTL